MLDLQAGLELKKQGMQIALSFGKEKWSDQVLAAMRDVLAKSGEFGHEFAMEEMRSYLLFYNLVDQPRSSNAWGAITNSAVKQKLIEPTGKRRPAWSIKTHGHEIKTYRRVIQDAGICEGRK